MKKHYKKVEPILEIKLSKNEMEKSEEEEI
jgi:hypothetical protein